MKKLLLIVCVGGLIFNLSAQNKEKSEIKEKIEFTVDTTLVLTLDSTIRTLYDMVSGEKDAERNWKQFKYLFKPNAKLITWGRDEYRNYDIRYMSPQDYIKSSGEWLVENGFFEKEIHRKIDRFGNIAHVFSTYESFYTEEDEEPFMRGINSIQLLFDGKRWWIINIYWSSETFDNPIPGTYLPKN